MKILIDVRCGPSLTANPTPISPPAQGGSREMVALYSSPPVKTGVQSISNPMKTLDVLARFAHSASPSVARLEFAPMKIGAGMT